MDTLPSNIIFNIFSRVPVKCLARSRCVSKVWWNYIDDRYLTMIHDKLVEEPTPILYHRHLCRDRLITCSLCFHVIESKQTAGASDDYVLEAKENPLLEFLRNTRVSRSSRVKIRVQGSCNGLICLLQDNNDVITSLVVVHPLRKESNELPRLSIRFEDRMLRDSCGLGYDASTNTLKMVCVLCKSNKVLVFNNPDVVKKYLCTMVHVFGTNSWREIPQVPSYPISGKPIFANGCLHWFAIYDIKTEDGGRPVIWFDVEKEEFGLIDPPRTMCDRRRIYCRMYDQVVDLNGEVGYVCTMTMEFWLLNHKKEWVPHCRFAHEIIPQNARIYVIGCWNKDGDILKKTKNNNNYRYAFFVYNLKSGVLQKTNIVGNDGWSPDFIMYPNTLSSIYGINTSSTFLKKTVLQKSCQHVLSIFH